MDHRHEQDHSEFTTALTTTQHARKQRAALSHRTTVVILSPPGSGLGQLRLVVLKLLPRNVGFVVLPYTYFSLIRGQDPLRSFHEFSIRVVDEALRATAGVDAGVDGMTEKLV